MRLQDYPPDYKPAAFSDNPPGLPAAIFTIGNKSTYIDVGGVLYTDVSGDTFLFPPAIILCLIL